MQWNTGTVEKRLTELGMDDLPVIQVRPTPHAVDADWFKKYHDLAHTFAMSLTDSVQELAFMNLPSDDFMDLILGHRMPENLSLRLRVPLIWGGKLEIDNMFLCMTFPNAHNMDRLIIEQSGNDVIWMPNPAKKVYLPAHMMNGGDGGNATTDRLSQLAAQIVASRGME